MQFVTLASPRGPVSVMNFHGLWNGRGKGDSADRLVQSRRLLDFLASRREPFVLCGDFNPRAADRKASGCSRRRARETSSPNSASTSTRTSLYTGPERFADYVFVSPGVDVSAFRVLPDEVSDHAPLMLEFGLKAAVVR